MQINLKQKRNIIGGHTAIKIRTEAKQNLVFREVIVFLREVTKIHLLFLLKKLRYWYPFQTGILLEPRIGHFKTMTNALPNLYKGGPYAHIIKSIF